MLIALTKICSNKNCKKTGIEQSIDNFYKNKSSKYGIREKCKNCCDVQCNEWRNNNKEYLKKYTKEYWNDENNIRRKQEYDKNYRTLNIEKIKKNKKEYMKKTRKKFNKKCQEKYKNDTIYKLKLNLRRRLSNVFRRSEKKGSAVKDLGCTGEFLKQHLEQKFYPNSQTGQQMSWNNYGNGRLAH